MFYPTKAGLRRHFFLWRRPHLLRELVEGVLVLLEGGAVRALEVLLDATHEEDHFRVANTTPESVMAFKISFSVT